MNVSTPQGSLRGVAYGLFCYLGFGASFAYFILFVTDILVPTSINAAPSHRPPVAIAINLALVLMWGLQHSLMARRSFKDKMAKIMPRHTERATYCLASAVALFVVCVGWSPIAGDIWLLEGPAEIAVRVVGALGWAILLAASFEIDHFELFGVKQGWYARQGRAMPESTFKEGRLYKLVRHPIQLGIFVGIWATPHMSAGHLVFASSMTAYILIGLFFEERDLIRQFGSTYREYRTRVPKLVPFGPRSTAPVGHQDQA